MKLEFFPIMRADTVNFFFFRTEAEAICCCQIVNNLKQDEENYLFSFKKNPMNIASRLTSAEVGMMENQATNFFSRTLEIKRQIAVLLSKLDDPSRIVLHVSRFFNSTTGYYIYALQKRYPAAEIVVHKYPHSLGSQKIRMLSGKQLRKLQFKKYARSMLGLSFYSEIRDFHGFLSPIMEKVYVMPGMEENVRQYHHNVASLPFSGLPYGARPLKKRMLVIGQANITSKHMSHEDAARIPGKLIEIAKAHALDGIDYLPHPRRLERMEMYDESFNIVSTEYSAEILAIDEMYEVVASFTSTAIFFVKLLLGDAPVRVISVGTNRSGNAQDLKMKHRIMDQLGVERVPV
jgi:hypothetical protein